MMIIFIDVLLFLILCWFTSATLEWQHADFHNQERRDISAITNKKGNKQMLAPQVLSSDQWLSSWLSTTCPSGWMAIEEKEEDSIGSQSVRCVTFHYSMSVNIRTANRACQSMNGGHLIDFDSRHIALMIAQHLKTFPSPIANQTWWINGRRRHNVDRLFELHTNTHQFDVNYDLWADGHPIEHNDYIAFAPTQHTNEYRLISSDAHALYSYICELDEFDRRVLVYRQEGFHMHYAPTLIDNPSHIESDTLFHYSELPNKYVILECASSVATTSIRWYKSGMLMNVTEHDSATIILNGALVLYMSQSSDYTSYHCTASNQFGTVRSLTSVVRPAFVKPFAPFRLDVFAFDVPGARIDCQSPEHAPSQSQSYSWMFDDSTDHFVSQTSRIFISHDGTLLFSYNKRKDQTTYACSITSSHTHSGQYGQFFNLILGKSLLLARPFAPIIDQYFIKIFPERPHYGQTVILECFAYGRPAPKYEWLRIGKETFPLNSSIHNFGRILKIASIRLEDAGIYRCIAGNSLGIVHADITIHVEIMPTVIIPLYDQFASTNSVITFICHILSDPLAHIEWFKDAIPISPLLMNSRDRHRIIVDNNNLTIIDTQLSDNGIYQCIASSYIGSATTFARLTIANYRPTFEDTPMTKKVYIVEGNPLSLACIYRSSPIGAVDWRRVGSLVDDGHARRIKTPNGTLLISRVNQSDAGIYVCSASNQLGIAHQQVQLIVLPQPHVRIDPQSVYLTKKSDINLTCEIEIPCNNDDTCPEPLFIWTFNDRPIRSLAQFRKLHPIVEKHSFMTTLNIDHDNRKILTNIDKLSNNFDKIIVQRSLLTVPSSLGRDRFGQFACTSAYGIESTNIDHYPVPLAPIQLKLIQIASDFVRLSCRQPIRTHDNDRQMIEDKVNSYRIELRTDAEKHWSSHKHSQMSSSVVDNSVVVSFRLDHLRPYTQYQFRVRARGLNGISDASQATAWIRTNATAPTDMVTNVRAKLISNQWILVEWNRLTNDQCNGPNLRYLLSINNDTVINTTTNIQLVNINASQQCEQISLAVAAINDYGNGPISNQIKIVASDGATSRRLNQLSAFAINSTHFNISWEWTNVTDCENVIGNEIICENVANTAQILKVVTSSNAHSAIISNAVASSRYRCHILAINHQQLIDNESMDYANLSIIVSTPSSPPTDIVEIRGFSLYRQIIDNTDNISAILEWTAIDFGPIDDETNQSLSSFGYRIDLRTGETSRNIAIIDVPLQLLTDIHHPSIVIDGLHKYQYYIINIVAYNSGGYSRPSQTLHRRLTLDHDGISSSIDYRPTLIIILTTLIVCNS